MTGITAAKVRELRDRTGCGLAQAKHALQTQASIAQIDDLQENGTLEQKVDFLLSRMKGQLTHAHHPADETLMEMAREILQEESSPTLG